MNETNIKRMGLLASLIGMILYRIASNYYGVSGVKLLAYVCTGIGVLGVISLILMKEFSAAFFVSMMVLPFIVIGIGMYLNNFLIMDGGFVLLFIMLFALIKIYKK